MKIINCTPHPVNIININGDVAFSIQPSGIVPRAHVTSVQVGGVNGIPVVRSRFGEIVGSPDPQEDTVFVVSMLTAQADKSRSDFVIPNNVVRDDSGAIIGCRSFATVANTTEDGYCTCNNCGHRWLRRSDRRSLRCPNCGSSTWDRERTASTPGPKPKEDRP